ncbi:MAG TPA: glutathione S-transferase family protein [Myxococcales bacterium]|nr:glutathione S-transferase family protein [Myxococcales bacterium]
MLKLYDCIYSGNGYKPRLLLRLLGIPFERVEVDLEHGETRSEDFLKINPEGRIPVLQLDDGSCLSESNAILCFLADGTPWLPADRVQRARVMQWLFWEQYSHEPNIATVRHWLQHDLLTPERRAVLDTKRALGRRALAIMEAHLGTHRYFAGEAITIADLALYAYTHVAHEGGFDLQPLPSLRAWLDRVRDRPGFTPITQP